jgi:hypothetical protein
VDPAGRERAAITCARRAPGREKCDPSFIEVVELARAPRRQAELVCERGFIEELPAGSTFEAKLLVDSTALHPRVGRRKPRCLAKLEQLRYVLFAGDRITSFSGAPGRGEPRRVDVVGRTGILLSRSPATSTASALSVEDGRVIAVAARWKGQWARLPR